MYIIKRIKAFEDTLRIFRFVCFNEDKSLYIGAYWCKGVVHHNRSTDSCPTFRLIALRLGVVTSSTLDFADNYGIDPDSLEIRHTCACGTSA